MRRLARVVNRVCAGIRATPFPFFHGHGSGLAIFAKRRHAFPGVDPRLAAGAPYPKLGAVQNGGAP